MPLPARILALALFQLAPAPSPSALLDDVHTLAAAEDNDQRFDALTAMLRARNVAFTVEPFTLEKPAGRDARTRGRNIVVSLGEGAQEIVLGAHYDEARLTDGSLSRGAVDNGASSVMLVHLAEALRAETLPGRVTIVWFDMEEVGLVGSRRYVERRGAAAIRAMVNFDVNAYGDTVLFSAPGNGEPAFRRAFMMTCAQEVVDCVRFTRLPASDDRSFARAGVPTFSVAMLPAVEAHQLWLLLNGGPGSAPGREPAVLRTIHTENDVPQKVEGATIARVHRFALALTRRLMEP